MNGWMNGWMVVSWFSVAVKKNIMAESIWGRKSLFHHIVVVHHECKLRQKLKIGTRRNREYGRVLFTGLLLLTCSDMLIYKQTDNS